MSRTVGAIEQGRRFGRAAVKGLSLSPFHGNLSPTHYSYILYYFLSSLKIKSFVFSVATAVAYYSKYKVEVGILYI